jgi:hypothetical protein
MACSWSYSSAPPELQCHATELQWRAAGAAKLYRRSCNSGPLELQWHAAGAAMFCKWRTSSFSVPPKCYKPAIKPRRGVAGLLTSVPLCRKFAIGRHRRCGNAPMMKRWVAVLPTGVDALPARSSPEFYLCARDARIPCPLGDLVSYFLLCGRSGEMHVGDGPMDTCH